MRLRSCILILAVAASAVAARASDPPPERAWPLDAEPAIASSFCEYREGHLHAGIDIRSFGREGIPCVAAGDGYVSRVRASPVGYGKALYIQLDDGQTLVYAHLSQFERAIDSAMVVEQNRLGRYSVDFRLPRNRIRVRRGDIIAFSGSTGGVDPHLHFEVRNAREHPLDPFNHGFALDDTLRPVIERVAFVPLSFESVIDGATFPMEFATREVSPGRYTIDDTVGVDGDVSLQLLAYDLLNRDSGRLAPQSLVVLVDGKLVARIEFEAMSFANAGEVEFVYDIGRVRQERQYWYQLYPRRGETLWNRAFPFFGLISGTYADGSTSEVLVRVADTAGNQCELSFNVLNGLIDRDAWARTSLDFHAGEIPGLYAYGNLLSIHRGAGLEWIDQPEEVRSDRFGIASSATAIAIHDVPVSLRAGSRVIDVWSAFPGEPRRVPFPSLGLAVGIGPRTVYGDAVMYATAWDGATANEQDLTTRSGVVQIGPFNLTLRADMEIRMVVTEPDSATAIYRRGERNGKWVHYPSTIEGDTVVTTAKRPGVYAVFRDTTPPAIAQPVVAQRLIYATGKTLPELQVPIDDQGSGVEYKRCAVFLDGIKQIARWDGRAKKLFVLIRDENTMGPRALTVVAYDNIGHRSQLDSTVDIPRRK